MSKLLINEPIIAFQPSLAKMAGVDGALVLQQIHYWISSPKIGKKHEGKKWVRNSIDDWCRDNFPFWNRSKISRVLVKLEDDGFISSRSDLNTYGPDRTKWYTVNYDYLENYSQFSEMRNGEDDDGQFSKMRNGEGEAILKNETTIYKDYNKTTLTIPSGSLPTPENPSQNGTHAKTKPEGVPAKKRAAKKPTPYNEICRELTEKFSKITRIPIPTNGAALNKLWQQPLVEIYGWFYEKGSGPWKYDEKAMNLTVDLIQGTYQKMKTPEPGKRDGLTVANPNSIINCARDLYGTRRYSHTESEEDILREVEENRAHNERKSRERAELERKIVEEREAFSKQLEEAQKNAPTPEEKAAIEAENERKRKEEAAALAAKLAEMRQQKGL